MTDRLTRRGLLASAAAGSIALLVPAARAEPILDLVKDPACGCCTAHAAYLEANGFVVTVRESDDLAGLRAAKGVPEQLAGCHMILVEDYVVEGHVPAGAIRKLLDERPAIKGISVPGMPSGSPGMSGPKESPLQVVEIGDGLPRVFFTE